MVAVSMRRSQRGTTFVYVASVMQDDARDNRHSLVRRLQSDPSSFYIFLVPRLLRPFSARRSPLLPVLQSL